MWSVRELVNGKQLVYERHANGALVDWWYSTREGNTWYHTKGRPGLAGGEAMRLCGEELKSFADA
jgi:hypothetical protein